MVVRWPIAFVAMHAACSSSETMPDARTADAPIVGLTIEMVAKGGVPQMPTADIEITNVLIGATVIRAIGDAAPGDMRTTHSSHTFDFHDDLMAVPILFLDAPPGVYSKVDFHVTKPSPEARAFDLRGRVLRNSIFVPFEIKSEASDIRVAVGIDVDLVPRAIAVAAIEVDVRAILANVDWNSVPLSTDGQLLINDGDPEMADVVLSIPTAFRSR